MKKEAQKRTWFSRLFKLDKNALPLFCDEELFELGKDGKDRNWEYFKVTELTAYEALMSQAEKLRDFVVCKNPQYETVSHSVGPCGWCEECKAIQAFDKWVEGK